MLTNTGAKPTATNGTNDSVARYNLFNAWPAATVAGANNVMQQEWSLVFESIQR